MKGFLRIILQEIMKKKMILGTSDAWSTKRLSHRPSVLYSRLTDFKHRFLKAWSTAIQLLYFVSIYVKSFSMAICSNLALMHRSVKIFSSILNRHQVKISISIKITGSNFDSSNLLVGLTSKYSVKHPETCLTPLVLFLSNFFKY